MDIFLWKQLRPIWNLRRSVQLGIWLDETIKQDFPISKYESLLWTPEGNNCVTMRSKKKCRKEKLSSIIYIQEEFAIVVSRYTSAIWERVLMVAEIIRLSSLCGASILGCLANATRKNTTKNTSLRGA